jgi:hypothetical protein
MMLHFMHFCRFFTKVLLNAMSGAPSKYIVDIRTQIQKDAPSLSAARSQNPKGHLTLGSQNLPVGRFVVLCAPVLFHWTLLYEKEN